MVVWGLWAVAALLTFIGPIDSKAIQNDFYWGSYQAGVPAAGMPGSYQVPSSYVESGANLYGYQQPYNNEAYNQQPYNEAYYKQPYNNEAYYQQPYNDEAYLQPQAYPQNDQKGFESNIDQITYKINEEKETKHYGEMGYELSSSHPGDQNHVAEGMPYEVLLKGGNYYDTTRKHTYMSASTALTIGAIIGVIFLFCGFLLAMIYNKTGWSITDALCESEIERAEKIREIEEMEQKVIPCCECPASRQVRPVGWRHKKKKLPKKKNRGAGEEPEAMAAMTAADDDVTPGGEY